MRQILYLVILCFVGLDVHAQMEPRLVLPIGHTEGLLSGVFSPDGRLVLTSSEDETTRLYEVSSGKELQVLAGHKAVFSPDTRLVLTACGVDTSRIYEVSSSNEILALAGYLSVFSPDGRLVLTASWDNTAHIYDVSSGKQLNVLNGHTEWISTVVFSPDGRLALTVSNDLTARIYEVSTGKQLQLLEGHKKFLNSAVFSPDSRLVLTAGDDCTARIYEVSSGREMWLLVGHTAGINSAVFSSDGKYALTASSDNTARIYDVPTGKEVQVLEGHNFSIDRAVFSPDGSYVLTAGLDGTACLYDVSTGKQLRELSGHTDAVISVVFSPDGKLALTACGDNKARIYEISSGSLMQVFTGNTKAVTSAVFSPDGKLILASYEDSSRIYEIATGMEQKELGGTIDGFRSSVFSPDGRLALTVSNDLTARIYEVSTGKQLNLLEGHKKFLQSAVFSPDSRLVLTAGDDCTARIYEVSSGREMCLLVGHTAGINSAVFSSDGKYALTVSSDNTARIYDVSTGKELQVLDGYNFSIDRAVFSPDGSYVITAGLDGTACLYEVSTGKQLRELTGHTDAVISVVFSPDGKLALTASKDNTARIYELSKGKELQVLTGHKVYAGGINFQVFDSAVFSPDAKLVLTGSNDNTAFVYEVSTGKVLHVLKGHTQFISSAVFSRDGKYILTTGADHKTILWDAATGKALYTRLQLKGNDWLVYDEHYRFDGTPGAIEKLYFVCGLEVIDLAQMKDSLWVPGLVEKITTNQPILINDKPAPMLSELNICELTPVIEPIELEDKRMLKYRITPRRGALGDTELYINGNLTYTYKPEKLDKKKEGSTTVYYLTIDSDTLQSYLAGKQNTANPVLIKSKVKGTGIYGRGEQCNIAKKSSKDDSHFYGVFIGVNDYGNERKEPNEQHYKNLDFAVKDAQDLSVAVEQTARNLFKDNCHIYRLTGEGNTPPTKENLQKVLADIGSKSKASDVLYIFFAGHGDVRRMKDTLDQVVVEQDQIRFMMQRADKRNPVTTSFGVRELSDWCSPRKIKAQKRVFVFDACHSGKITQEAAGGFRGDDEGTRIRQLDKLKDKNGMMILAAAADDESAYEDETLNQGVLTYHLLQVMKEEAKDTSLVVRDWFDETIDLVKEYSRLNGNKQEPSSFGDGRFEIGNVRDNVRDSIKITCPKTRVGACVFVAQGQAKLQFPNVKQRVNEYFASKGRGDQLVYSKNTDKAYRTEGLYLQIKDETQVTYDLYRGEELVKSGIELPLRKYTNEDELVQVIVNSIAHEIESLRDKDDQCKLRNK